MIQLLPLTPPPSRIPSAKQATLTWFLKLVFPLISSKQKGLLQPCKICGLTLKQQVIDALAKYDTEPK